MWRKCPQVLDEPVTILGLEPEDFAGTALVPVLAALVLDTLPSFACGAAVGAFLYFSKRGRAAGALLHRLHALELTRLPGLLSPRVQRYSAW